MDISPTPGDRAPAPQRDDNDDGASAADINEALRNQDMEVFDRIMKQDSDGDGVSDLVELLLGTDPNSPPPQPSSDDTKTPEPEPADTPTGQVDDSPDPSVRDFLYNVSTQLGVEHKRMAEADPNDPDPDAFDSSELVEWAARRAGVDMPDGSWRQFQHLSRQGSTTSVEDALGIPGALVFTFPTGDPMAAKRPAGAGVGISMGDGRIMEVRQGGQVALTSDPERYTHAGVIGDFGDAHDPGIDASNIVDDVAELRAAADDFESGQEAEPDPPVLPVDDETPNRWNRDSDGDGLTDGFEEFLSMTDPHKADTDGDGLSDRVEFNSPDSRFDPLRADTDGDGADDGEEAGRGLDPRSSDTDGDGISDGREIHYWQTDPADLLDRPSQEVVDLLEPNGEPVPVEADDRIDTEFDPATDIGVEPGPGVKEQQDFDESLDEAIEELLEPIQHVSTVDESPVFDEPVPIEPLNDPADRTEQFDAEQFDVDDLADLDELLE